MSVQSINVLGAIAWFVICLALGEVASALRRRWRQSNGEDTTYDVDDAKDRFWLGYRVARGLIFVAGVAALLVVTMKSTSPGDPWGAIRPRGWDCIFRTGDIVGCAQATKLED